MPFYGGASYRDRGFTPDVDGQDYSEATVANTGLIGRALNDYWVTQGYEFDVVTRIPVTNLIGLPVTAFTSRPTPLIWLAICRMALVWIRVLILMPFLSTTIPCITQVAVSLLQLFGSKSRASGCIPYNQWATHELYWVDGTFTYVINNVPVLQITPDADGLNGDDNVLSAFSSAGTGVLGF